jgi:sugar lactone lactonase YvrE
MKRLLCGFVVLGLFLGAVGQVRSDFIYWVDNTFPGEIQRVNSDGSGRTTLLSSLSNPADIALDVAGGKMYWTEATTGTVMQANLDGTGRQTLVTGLSAPSAIALDLAGGKMYWADHFGSDIRRANLDGSGQMTLLRGSSNLNGVALDLVGGKMYWSGDDGTIRRANLDGSEQQTVVRGLARPYYLALDPADGKIYWADPNAGYIQRANLDGTGLEILVRNLVSPGGIALDLANGKVYWTDFEIRRANLDGTGQETLVRNAGVNPNGMALDFGAPVPQPVLVTGYSADVISDKDPSTRFAQSFGAGMFAWFEAGAVDDDGMPHNDGLPAGGTFVSATGSGTTYQLQPANAQNVLQLSAGTTGTLTLTTPAVYNTLYVLTSSGDGTPSSVGSGNIHFADGSTQAFSFNSFDWCNGGGGLHPEAVLPGPNGRADVGPNGTAFAYNQDCDFQLYETVVAIDPSHAGVAITSIDFTGAPDAVSSNIFGVSGR